jgi:hypothetical protein
MVIATNREHLDAGSVDGSRVRGLARQVINGAGTTKQLLVSESGALCVFGTAAGQVYTLPIIGADDVGMFFDFTVTVTGTAAYSVDTGSAANFIGGGIVGMSTTAGGSDAFAATIASDVSIDLDSTETGEDAGGLFTLTAISLTEWACGGYTVGSGTIATPFA